MRPHVVIVGGGFAGLAAARGLRREPVRITLVDRTNHHLFQPLLYQVATAALAPSDIAEPIRSILRRQENVSVRLAEVTAIDLAEHRMTLVDEGGRTEDVAWDKLVLAAGARHSYFGNDAWVEHAPGLKTLGDALEIRRRILTAFERAEWTRDPDDRRMLTTFIVVGGGPTGVELAGALAEIATRTLHRNYRNLDPSQARIVLIEGTHAVLGTYPPDLQERARAQLQSLGVEVRLGDFVTRIDAEGVVVGEQRIPAATVLWAAGVQGAPVARTLGVPLDRAGRVPVNPDLSLPAHPDAFIAGDLAAVPDVPGLAPAATQMGAFVAKAIRADLRSDPRASFRYKDKGNMATIGRSRAVMDAAGLHVSGVIAWLAWVFVHILFLVTFRNRVIVLIKWAWAWLTFERASRLIWRPTHTDV